MPKTAKSKPQRPKDNVIQGVSFSPDELPLLEYAKQQAEADGRSLANWIRRLIEQHRSQNPQSKPRNGNPQTR